MTQLPPPPEFPEQSDRPDFVPPPPQWVPPPEPSSSWSAPVVSVPPQSAPPPRRRRAGVIVVAALIVVGMAVAAIWITPGLITPAAIPTAPNPTAAPATTTEPSVVTVTPVPQPTTKTVLTEGGDVGRPTSFRTAGGTGDITVTKATWSQAGLMAPPPGQHYLVVEMMITCKSGTVAVSSLSLVAGADPAVGTAFGPTVKDPLPGVTLTPGQATTGQVGFVIPADTTAITLLAPNRHAAATIEVPGP